MQHVTELASALQVLSPASSSGCLWCNIGGNSQWNWVGSWLVILSSRWWVQKAYREVTCRLLMHSIFIGVSIPRSYSPMISHSLSGHGCSIIACISIYMVCPIPLFVWFLQLLSHDATLMMSWPFSLFLQTRQRKLKPKLQPRGSFLPLRAWFWEQIDPHWIPSFFIVRWPVWEANSAIFFSNAS